MWVDVTFTVAEKSNHNADNVQSKSDYVIDMRYNREYTLQNYFNNFANVLDIGNCST